LKNQNARPLGVRRVVFNHDRSVQTRNHLFSEQAIRSEFVVSVGGDSQGTRGRKCLNPCERGAHPSKLPPGLHDSKSPKQQQQPPRSGDETEASISGFAPDRGYDLGQSTENEAVNLS
jgi:hypothetical protein